MGLADNTQDPSQGWWGSSPLEDLAAIIAAGAGAAGIGFNVASAASGGGGGGGRNPRFARIPGTAYQNALGRYGARLLALNAGTRAPTFQEFLQSGGKASFDVKGLNEFTPQEAVRLGLVSGMRRFPVIPYYDPTAEGAERLSPAQQVFLRQQRRKTRRTNKLQPSGGGGGGKKKEPVQITIGTNTGDWAAED